MDRIPMQDMTKIVKLYFATNSVVLAQRTFRREFPGRHCPCERTIKRLVDKFRNTGSLAHSNKGHGDRPILARTPANIQAVRDRWKAIPTKINKAAVTGSLYLKDICMKSHTQRLHIVSLQDINSPTTNRCKQSRKVKIRPKRFWKNWKQPGSSRPHFLQRWSPFSSQWTYQ